MKKKNALRGADGHQQQYGVRQINEKNALGGADGHDGRTSYGVPATCQQHVCECPVIIRARMPGCVLITREVPMPGEDLRYKKTAESHFLLSASAAARQPRPNGLKKNVL